MNIIRRYTQEMGQQVSIVEFEDGTQAKIKSGFTINVVRSTVELTAEQKALISGTYNPTVPTRYIVKGAKMTMEQAQTTQEPTCPQDISRGDYIQISGSRKFNGLGTVISSDREYDYNLPRINGRPQVVSWMIEYQNEQSGYCYWKQRYEGGQVEVIETAQEQQEQWEERSQNWEKNNL